MQYSQFQNQLNTHVTGSDITCRVRCYGHIISETVDQTILVDNQKTEFSSIEEARTHLKQQDLCSHIEQEIQQEIYESLPGNKVVNIIKEHYADIRITDTLIDSYVELASSKMFTADPVAIDIRNLNKMDRLIESHIDFKLDDGTVIVISEGTQSLINNTFAEHLDVIEHMRSSKENFLNVLDQLGE